MPTHVNGRRTDNWETLETVYARIRALGSSERGDPSPEREVATHEITTRRRIVFGDDPAMRTRYRIVSGDEVFDIASVSEDLRRTGFAKMQVREVVQ